LNSLLTKLFDLSPMESSSVIPKAVLRTFNVLEVVSAPDVFFRTVNKRRNVWTPEVTAKGPLIRVPSVGFAHAVHGQEESIGVKAGSVDPGCCLPDMSAIARRVSL